MRSLGILALALACRDQSPKSNTPPAPGPLHAIRVQLDSVVAEGDTVSFKLQAWDAQGRPTTTEGVTFTVDGGSIVGPTRLVPSGDTVGLHLAAIATRASDGAFLKAEASARVIGRVVRLTVLPKALATQPGITTGVRVFAFSRLDSLIEGATLDLASRDTTVATVAKDGTVTARTVGTTVIQATQGGVRVELPVEVRAPTADGPYPIAAVYLRPPSPELEAAVAAAAARWQRVLRGTAPPAAVNLAAGICTVNAPAMSFTTTGITVLVRLDSIDGRGGTAGWGGPCVLRPGYTTGTYRPAVGVITLDTADVSSPANMLTVLTHEIGHTLGVGTGWYVRTGGGGYLIKLSTDPGGPDPHFTGASGNAAAALWGFIPEAWMGLPLENAMGAGSRDSHWRSTIADLMNPFGGGPLSAFTAASLEDLGYRVDVSGAEPNVPRVRSTVGSPVRSAFQAPGTPIDDGPGRVPVVGVASPTGTTLFR